MLSSPDAASTQERASNLYRTLLPVHSPELKKYEHISPVLASLHWLPVKSRIDFKVLLLTYKALKDLAPNYLKELVVPYCPPRPLRSQSAGLLVITRISKNRVGRRACSYRAPLLWNNLPASIRDADTLPIFKSRLKTFLFSASNSHKCS